MFGMQFFVNFETQIVFVFLERVAYKKMLFGVHFKSIENQIFCCRYR